ncbi:MAG TPA: hypothetical protein VKA63_04730 [Candidatus Krumholzibacteria bacterium]|nr:hypothetical protein [Candidatus Krumholzibacteria bacterium]
MKPDYRILLRPREAQNQELECAPVREKLRAVPGISAQDERLHHFGEEDEHGVMTIQLAAGDVGPAGHAGQGAAAPDRSSTEPGSPTEPGSSAEPGSSTEPGSPGHADESAADLMRSIEISIPRFWIKARGPQVFAIVFMMQGWTGFEVYDPQIDSTLERETVLQGMVAMRQAQLENQGLRVPKPRLKDDSE